MKFKSWVELKFAVIKDRIKTFSLVTKPRPDFSKAEITLYNFITQEGDKKFYSVHAVFPEYPGEMAKKYKWITNYEEYMILADLEFKRRFPEHEFSKNAWKNLHFPDEEIRLAASGQKRLIVERGEKEVTIQIV